MPGPSSPHPSTTPGWGRPPRAGPRLAKPVTPTPTHAGNSFRLPSHAGSPSVPARSARTQQRCSRRSAAEQPAQCNGASRALGRAHSPAPPRATAPALTRDAAGVAQRSRRREPGGVHAAQAPRHYARQRPALTGRCSRRSGAFIASPHARAPAPSPTPPRATAPAFRRDAAGVAQRSRPREPSGLQAARSTQHAVQRHPARQRQHSPHPPTPVGRALTAMQPAQRSGAGLASPRASRQHAAQRHHARQRQHPPAMQPAQHASRALGPAGSTQHAARRPAPPRATAPALTRDAAGVAQRSGRRELGGWGQVRKPAWTWSWWVRSEKYVAPASW
jgi:hypothetical protein